MFVLDSSGSIGASNFQNMRNFVTTVVNALEIGPGRSQVGVIVFSSTARVQFNLNTYSDKPSLLSAITRIPFLSGGTNTDEALELLITQGFTGSRPDMEAIPKIAMVVTDGQSNNPPRTVQAANQLHQTSITTYAIGIGGADVTELSAIASTHNGVKLVRYISSFNAVELSALQEELRDQACTGEL